MPLFNAELGDRERASKSEKLFKAKPPAHSKGGHSKHSIRGNSRQACKARMQFQVAWFGNGMLSQALRNQTHRP